jgi:deoxyribose-phosphate aldolase
LVVDEESGDRLYNTALNPMTGDGRDWLKELPGYVDSTLLGANVSRERITELCDEAAQESFVGVCVNPTHVRFTRRLLEGKPTKLVTVIGFPLGANSTAVKTYEAADAVTRSADEIDMVMNISAFLHGYEDFVRREIREVVGATDGRPVKVIIETGLLTDEQKRRAAEIAASAGAAFVKTSTGFFNPRLRTGYKFNRSRREPNRYFRGGGYNGRTAFCKGLG